MMTAAHIAANLDAATIEHAAAMARFHAATTAKARRAAAEDVEFWSNKKAFFGNIRPEGGR